MENSSMQVKVVLLGDSGVGKSSIMLSMVMRSFDSEKDPTLGAAYMTKTISLSNKSIKFNIWDTAGQERFHSLAQMYYRDANAAVLVYDITRKETYDGLMVWYDEVKEYGPKDIIIAIVGNKEDRVNEEVVDSDTATTFAESIDALYAKTSAKTSYGVETLFLEIAKRMNPEIQHVLDEFRRGSRLGEEEIILPANQKGGCCS